MHITAHRRTAPHHHEGFAILIPTWNNLPYLRCCIQSIRQHAALPHQIIVHINDGSDGTLEWVRQQPDLDYTHSPDNIGICYAMNAARPLISRPYVAYFNDDMYALPGWDTALMQRIRRLGTDDFFLSATMIERRDSGNPCVIIGDFGDLDTGFDEVGLLQNGPTLPKNDWYGATWPPNVVSLAWWDRVGGYSTEFTPGFYSDPDFSRKLWQGGVRIFIGVADSRVYHFGSLSTRRVKANRGRHTFLLKWGHSSAEFTAKFLRRGQPVTTPTLPDQPLRLSFFQRCKRAVAALRF